MAKIRSKDTKPEWIVRRYLFSRGYRYRKNMKGLPGTPDIVLCKYGIVIFIHGCFWHGHEGCKYFRLPKSNVEFWAEKIERNIERDTRNEAELKALGWRVIRVWECDIKAVTDRKEYLQSLYNTIINPFRTYYEGVETTDISIAAEPDEFDY